MDRRTDRITITKTVKTASHGKNCKCVIMKVKRYADFILKMHQKRLEAGLRRPPGPAGGAYSAPQTLYLDIWSRVRRGEEKETEGRMRVQKEVTGEGQVGREEREGRQGKGGQKGKGKERQEISPPRSSRSIQKANQR